MITQSESEARDVKLDARIRAVQTHLSDEADELNDLHLRDIDFPPIVATRMHRRQEVVRIPRHTRTHTNEQTIPIGVVSFESATRSDSGVVRARGKRERKRENVHHDVYDGVQERRLPCLATGLILHIHPPHKVNRRVMVHMQKRHLAILLAQNHDELRIHTKHTHTH